MEKDVETTKIQYEGKITKIRESRVSLVIIIVLEVFVFLLHCPGFLGVEWIENVLTALRDFLVALLWPARPGDMATYKGTIYQIITWFKGLPASELIFWVIRYAAPILLVLSYVRVWLLKRRINMADKPPRERKPIRIFRKGKKDADPWFSFVTRWFSFGNHWESGVFASAASEANEYCKKVRERCDNPFAKEPGVRVQRLSGDIGLGERRDYVIPWNDNGIIELSPILRTNAYLALEKNNVYLYKDNVRSPYPLERYVPFLCNAKSSTKTTTICAITWIGG